MLLYAYGYNQLPTSWDYDWVGVHFNPIVNVAPPNLRQEYAAYKVWFQCMTYISGL